MTKEELEEIATLEKAATPLPWRACGEDRGGCQCCTVWSTSADIPVADTRSSVGCDMKPNSETLMLADAAFIARIRDACPALLAYVAELEKTVALHRATLGSPSEMRDQRDAAQKRVAELERAIDDFITAAKVPQS